VKLNFITDKLYTTNIILFLINNFNYVRKKQVAFQILSTQFYNFKFNTAVRKFNQKECRGWKEYKKRTRFVVTSSEEDNIEEDRSVNVLRHNKIMRKFYNKQYRTWEKYRKKRRTRFMVTSSDEDSSDEDTSDEDTSDEDTSDED
jgi:hypothetical protein